MPLLRICIFLVTSVLAMVSGSYSLVDWLALTGRDASGGVVPLAVEAKAALEFKIRGLGVLALLGLNLLHDYFTFIRPQLGVAAFRKSHLDTLQKDWSKAKRFPPGMRVNVMYVRRCWYFGWLVRRFAWTWNWNFRPPQHKDANLWLHVSQGVCGRAYKDERAKFVRTDGLTSGSWLLPWQANRTTHVLAILSVPILLEVGSDSKSWRCVGVINVDAVTEAAADSLERNAGDLGDYFMKLGFVLAQLS